MVKKLKCWKKIRTTKTDDVWKDKLEDIYVGVYPNRAYPVKKNFEVDIDIRKKVTTLGKNKKWTKKEALLFAKEYMEKHDCKKR